MMGVKVKVQRSTRARSPVKPKLNPSVQPERAIVKPKRAQVLTRGALLTLRRLYGNPERPQVKPKKKVLGDNVCAIIKSHCIFHLSVLKHGLF